MIRPYRSEDKEELVALLRLNTPRYFDEAEEDDFREYLEKHLEHYLVVEENNRIIGAGGINYFPETRQARLSWDVLHPNFQGKGIGSALTRFRIDEIRKKGVVDEIVVRTSQLVYRFYEKMGFALVRTEKDFWAKGIDLYYMSLPLDGRNATSQV